jgi:leukotriene-A4 hydrolase
MKFDPTTQTNYTEIASEHLALDWHVDFDAKIVSGSVIHTLRVKEDDVKEVVYVRSLNDNFMGS